MVARDIVRQNCGKCGGDVRRERRGAASVRRCIRCGLCATTLSALNHWLPRETWNGIRRTVVNASEPSPLTCPCCGTRAVEAAALSETFGYCPTCQLILFDRGFLQRAQPSPALSKAARRSVAIVRAAAMADRGKETVADSPPELGKRAASYLGVLLTGGLWGGFGLPFESGGKMLRRAPWATWSLCAVMGFLSWRAFGDLDGAAERYGVISAEAARNLGGRFVSSFFVHAGWFHLLPSLYFLAVFGSNVEDSLGIGRFLLVVFLSNLAGDFMHVTFHPESDVPLIGSSAGITGLIAYSALRHPRRKVGMLCWIWPFFRILWIRLSLRVAFFLWLGWEIFRVNAGVFEPGDASPWMHLGGISAGVFFWAIWTEHEVPSRWRNEA